MSEQSFYEMMVIDTPEKAENLAKAFKDREERGPYVPNPEVLAMREEGKKWLRENPNWLKEESLD